MNTPAKRQCAATTRRGTPCSASPLKGEAYCSVHHPNAAEFTRFKPGPQPGAGRPRKPTLTEVLRDRVESDIEKWIEPFVRAVEGAVIVSTSGGKVIVSDHPDLEARQRAAERVFDRVYGRPRQATELSGPGGGVISVALLAAVLTDDERSSSDGSR